MPNRPIVVGVAAESGLLGAGLASMLAAFADRIVVRSGLDLADLDAPATFDLIGVELAGRLDHRAGDLRRLLARPGVGPVVLLAPSFTPSVVRAAREIGVRAFVSTDLDPSALADALLDAANGRGVLATRATAVERPHWWPGLEEGLSERESQVLALCAEGLSNREIADALFVSPDTVKSHLARVYRRLGLHNRAQAAAYVLGASSVAGSSPGRSSVGAPAATGAPATARRPHAPARPLAEQLGLDEGALAARRSLLGLDADVRARLLALERAARAEAGRVAAELVERWRRAPATAHHVRDPVTRERLIEHQHGYLLRLFAGDQDAAHVEATLRTGATHHRLHLAPQWYLASCGLVVCAHLDAIWAAAVDDADAIESVIALVRAVLFDAALVLDAYEMTLRDELVEQLPHPDLASARPVAAPAGEPRRAGPAVRRPFATMELEHDDAAARRAFLGLTGEHVAALVAARDRLEAALPDVLTGFYALLGTMDAVAGLVAEPAVVEALLGNVATYWSELLQTEFDYAYAASRVRVGVIHERIGVTPQFYLAGLAHQLGGLLRAAAGDAPTGGAIAPVPGGPRQLVDALVRAVFFDVTFVLDAYMDARASALLQVARFAGQVVAGLANGIAIVDARDRVEYANEHLLALSGVPAGVLHRLPVEHALAFDGIAGLVGRARTAADGRTTALYDAWGRRMRVTALRLQRSVTGRDGLVAVIVDDITEVLRAGEALDREGRRLDHVLDATDVVVWEADRSDLTVLAVSRGTRALLGVADTDLLGRRTLVDFVHADDRARFVACCRDTAADAPTTLVHRVLRADGQVRSVRSSIVAIVDPSGTTTVSGVMVDLSDVALGSAP